MFRPAFRLTGLWKIVILSVLLLSPVACVYGGGSARNVLVVENIHSPASIEIADHYAAARGIPYINRCRIRCSTSETVSRVEYETNVLAPIRRSLQNPAISDKIDYIVLTKGTPLRVEYGLSTGPLSVTSMLTCIGELDITSCFENPYGPLYWNPNPTAFSHQTNFYGRHLYLVTRLDGYTTSDVLAMIDRGLDASSPSGPVMLDQKYLGANPAGSSLALNQRIGDANNWLMQNGIPTIFDDTSRFLSGGENLMGYFSWGSNDPSYSRAAYTSNMFAPGSIADSYVSSSGRTFFDNPNGQSLVADLIAQGACGVCGHVSEPYMAYVTYPDILFKMYMQGFTLAESFYAACPMLFWKSVVVGDPLMAAYATTPKVSIVVPDEPLTGLAQLQATAVDPKGIAKVEFYMNGAPVGVSYSIPYSVPLDTTQYYVGTHAIEARAVQAGPVESESWASARVQIANPVSALRVIADAFGCDDGQGVWCADKVVMAGTADLGSNEFYVQEFNGASGIRVIWDGAVDAGDIVSIYGSLITDEGERSILAESVIIENSVLTLPAPRAMSNKTVGGGDATRHTPGITGGIGLRNQGLLIKTWGCVTYVGADHEDFFYIDDGSRLDDGNSHVGLRVKSRNLIKPTAGSFVIVTGISSCQLASDKIIRTIKLRQQNDIR